MNQLPLKISNLSVSYGDAKRALDDVSLELRPGEVLGVVGEGGSGKTTLIEATVGLLSNGVMVDGEIELLGTRLRSCTDAERQRLQGGEIGTIVSGGRARLNPMAKVGSQVKAVLVDHGYSRRDAQARVLELFKEVGIPDPVRRLEAYPHELSGGMAQRVVIAMAIACRPKVILADEPTRGLDVTIQADILELFGNLMSEIGASAILATRDLGIVAERCDRVAVLSEGRIAEIQLVRDFFRSPLSKFGQDLLYAERSVLEGGRFGSKGDGQ